jgi:hypothetical protein
VARKLNICFALLRAADARLAGSDRHHSQSPISLAVFAWNFVRHMCAFCVTILIAHSCSQIGHEC